MDVFIKIAQFVLALSLLIFVHEMGHYLFARLFKIRVDKFYLFFNPSRSILRAKRINGKWQFSWFSSAPPKEWTTDYADKTEWGLGWLPLGGYCKISGMIDESMDKEQMKQPPQEWEFRTRPAWQRMFVMIGGVLFNVLLAMCIYWGMLFSWGEQYLANRDVAYGVQCNALAQEMGFRNGDKILYIDGSEVEDFRNIQFEIVRNQAQEITVIRNNDTLTIPIEEHFIKALINENELIFKARTPFIVKNIPDTSHNAQAGLQPKDHIVGVDTLQTSMSQEEIRTALQNYKNQQVNLCVQRNDSMFLLPINVNEEGVLGIEIFLPEEIFSLVQKEYDLLTAFPAGVSKGLNIIKNYVKELRLIFSPKTEAYKSVGSFITMIQAFPAEWDWYHFWYLSALLSIMLAVINILPIPGLDGGHLLFVLYEMVSGRKPNEKFYEFMLWIGFVFLIMLMVFALGNDVIRNFFK